jgi:XTP/dITP diphosphohydrolase
VSAQNSPAENAPAAPIHLLLASSNSGKLREFRALASQDASLSAVTLDILPNFADLPSFDENAPTFAENAAGKALHYSRHTEFPVLADDSGLVVDALRGAPGVHSARYAGPNASDSDRVSKLLQEMGRSDSLDRTARFICVLALAQRGNMLAVVSDSAEGEIIDSPRGNSGFGYDPVFFVPSLGLTFAEMPEELKNLHSHRGKAFRKLFKYILSGSSRLASSQSSL